MADVISDAKILRKADGAKNLMENEAMRDAFAGVKAALLERFEACPIRDIEGQHEIKLMLKLLNDVRANLQSMIDSGKVVESRKSLLERANRGLNAFRS
jgi:hypothetical protein